MGADQGALVKGGGSECGASVGSRLCQQPSPPDIDLRVRGNTGDGRGRPRFLHLFSGPAGRSDGLAAALKRLGCECEDWDIVNGSVYDLADDATFRQLRARVQRGEFDGGLLGPPCHTFSNARKENDGGPRPLRLPGDRDIYGRPGLTPEEKEDVRLGTLLALRAADIFLCFYKLKKPVILEQPAQQNEESAVSMLNLPEFKRILGLQGVKHVKVAQCNYGAATDALHGLSGRCGLGLPSSQAVVETAQHRRLEVGFAPASDGQGGLRTC